MNVKAVVKVMNFHSLLRVDASRKQAEKYSQIEESLKSMMSMILGNKNLKLDNRIKMPKANAPVLKIYIGSDFGFCGGVNSSVVSSIQSDNDNSDKVIIGKKIKSATKDECLKITLEEFQNDFDTVRSYLVKEVREGCWSSIVVVYNHFFNSSEVKLVEKKIYPLETSESVKGEWDDFILEGDHDVMFEDMLILCLSYELKIAAVNSYASENIMRQNSTTESLKRIDEIEEDERKLRNKIRTQVSVNKTIDSYVKQKSLANK